MNMQEVSRLILGLRELGLSGDEINDFLLYIESGDENYKPKEMIKREQDCQDKCNNT
ncbi:MAG: hypothetical protein IJ608_10430 [Lachnospiraceae bacterium]|nr:hypothetical protein [Lachnospiraceae bacterium]